MTTTALTWFGGYIGAMRTGNSYLHLLNDEGDAFCGADGLHNVTAREASRSVVRWCETCCDAAQAVRRDVA